MTAPARANAVSAPSATASVFTLIFGSLTSFPLVDLLCVEGQCAGGTHTQDRPEHAWRPSAHRGIGRLNLGLRSGDGASPDWGKVTVSQRLTAPVDSSV